MKKNTQRPRKEKTSSGIRAAGRQRTIREKLIEDRAHAPLSEQLRKALDSFRAVGVSLEDIPHTPTERIIEALASLPSDQDLTLPRDIIDEHVRGEREAGEHKKQLIAELRTIRRELQQERQRREELETTVAAHEKQLSRYRTGAPGRPGSRHLIVEEFERLAARGQIAPTVRSQGEVLSSWLSREHPEAAQMQPRSVANVIRVLYREARASNRRRKGNGARPTQVPS